MIDQLPDSIHLQIFSFLGPYWSRVGQLINSRFRNLIRSSEYVTACLGEQQDRDFNRQLRRHIYAQPFSNAESPCVEEDVIPDDRIVVGVMANTYGVFLPFSYIAGYFVFEVQNLLYIINQLGTMVGPFTPFPNCDDFEILNSGQGSSEGPYLCYYQMDHFKITTPERIFNANPPHLPSSMFTVRDPYLESGRQRYIFSNGRILFHVKSTDTFYMHHFTYGKYGNCPNRLLWSKKFPKSTSQENRNFGFSGDYIIIVSRNEEKASTHHSVMLIDSNNGDFLKSWTADIQKPENFSLNFTTSQHVIGMSRTDDDHLRILCFDPLSDLDSSMEVQNIHGYFPGLSIMAPGNISVIPRPFNLRHRLLTAYCLVFDHERNEKMRISSARSVIFQVYILYRKQAGGPIYCHKINGPKPYKRVRRRY